MKILFVPLGVPLQSYMMKCGKSSVDAQYAAIDANREIADKNIAFQQETNALNIAEADKQRAWLEQQYGREVAEDWARWNAQNAYDEKRWNEQNAYNEDFMMRQPVMMREAFKRAGLNPALAMQGFSGSSGSGGSSSHAFGTSPSSSAPSTPNLMAPHDDMHVDPISYEAIDNAINNSLSQTIQVLQSVPDIQGKIIDNATRSSMNLAAIDKVKADIKHALSSSKVSNKEALLLHENLIRLQSTRDSYVNEQKFNALNAQLTGNVLKEQALNLAAQTASIDFRDRLAAAKQDIDAAVAQASIKRIYRELMSMDINDQLTKENIKSVAADLVTKDLQQQGIKLDNKTKEDLGDLVVKRYNEDLRSVQLENDQMEPDAWDARRYMERLNTEPFEAEKEIEGYTVGRRVNHVLPVKHILRR